MPNRALNRVKVRQLYQYLASKTCENWREIQISKLLLLVAQKGAVRCRKNFTYHLTKRVRIEL